MNPRKESICIYKFIQAKESDEIKNIDAISKKETCIETVHSPFCPPYSPIYYKRE
jgi:hypothetical protein